MKRLKSILSLLLCLNLTLGFQPTALAADDTGFSDVSADAWYAESVEYCTQNGLMSGTAENIFSPNTPMSRAMLGAVLYRMAGSPQTTGASGFSDVAQNTWYTNAVTWAVQNEIVSGYGNGLFGTNDPVTREQIATILWHYSGMLGRAVSESNDQPGDSAIDETASAFSDAASISSYSVNAVNWARGIGVIGGKPGNLFDPKGNATRAEVATILRNYSNVEQPEPAPMPAPESSPTPVTTLEASPEPTPSIEPSVTNVSVTVSDSVFSLKLYDNETAKAFAVKLPMTLTMSELNGNEKYYYLPERLPTNSQQVGNIQNGDLMLYGSDCLVLFYKSFSTSYSYTSLGTIDNPSGLAAALGNGSVRVSFTVSD